MEEINFKQIEEKWQKKWEEEKIYEVSEDSKKKKYYVLEMFPYPSGAGLHMGHMFNYTLGDVLARFKILNGFNVLHPGGYDSLGLPAENAAIKNGTHPEDYIKKSIANFMNQQKTLGLTYDWSRMVNTADSEYYKWDQWIFLKMLEKGLAYQKESAVNWCPKCNTVLANEQSQGGVCALCDTEVEIKHLKQWFLKITDYSDRLLEGHKKLDWPQKTLSMQKNWIGKSYGTEVDFEINGEKWPVFTTRVDTIFGVTFVVISAQHKRLMELVTDDQKEEVEGFLKKLKSVSEKELEEMEKEGVFTGSYAVNPVNGEKIPVYAGNFVVADYGSGVVMAVPTHDKRDFDFAKKYDIPLRVVISPEGENLDSEEMKDAYVDEGVLVNSGEFNGIKNKEAIEKITKWLEKKGIGRKTVNYKLRDWGISRQRYWGTPIPIVYCKKCGAQPVPEKELPIKLPKEVKFGEGNPLTTNEEWIKTKCPKCLGEARRETDTMDTFVNSSWYFLRYCDPHNKEAIFDKKKVGYWCPVDVYIGGAEHACMHLIYSRFYNMFLKDLGLVEFEEFAPRLFHQGMINDSSGAKMSKTKGNIVEPLETMAKYGVDTTRFFVLSVASPDKGFNWSEAGISGSLKLINRIINYFEKPFIGKDSEEVLVKLNKTIKNLSNYYENFLYRKATIELRELFELLEEQKTISKETLIVFLKLLNPICPHITEELYEKLGEKGFISTSSWPEFDESKIKIKKKKVDVELNLINNSKGIISKLEEKGKKITKAIFYVMPFEVDSIDSEKVSKELGLDVKIYATNDDKKIDPENKAKKARPGMPGIYFE
jgi:leucyl-tRNA synthetase